MFNPFKKNPADSKPKKKHLSDSLIGPGPVAYPQPDYGQNDLMSQVNKPATGFKNPFESFSKPPEASSNSGSNTPISAKSEVSSQRSESFNNEPEHSREKPSAPKIEDGSPSNNLMQFIQGNYFNKNQGIPSATKSFAVGSHSSDKDLLLKRENSAPLDKPTVTARHQRLGSLEVEIKEITPENDSGLVYDIILHHSEIRSGPKHQGKVFINNYLDMDNLRSDDLSHYSREMNRDIEVANPAKSIHINKKGSFEVKKFKGEDETNSSISHDPNLSILENVSISMDYHGPSSALDKETMDLLENFDLDDDANENKNKKQPKKNSPGKPKTAESPKIYENPAPMMQPDEIGRDGSKTIISPEERKRFEKKTVKNQPHPGIKKSKAAIKPKKKSSVKAEQETEEKPAEEEEAIEEEPVPEPEEVQEQEKQEEEIQPINQNETEAETEIENNENMKPTETEVEDKPSEKTSSPTIKVIQPQEPEPVEGGDSNNETASQASSKKQDEETIEIPRSKSSEATKPITPRTKSMNSQVELETEADLLEDNKSHKADSISLDSLSDHSSRRGSLEGENSLKEVGGETIDKLESPRSPNKAAKKDEEGQEVTSTFSSPDTKIRNINNATLLSEEKTSSKAVQNKYIAQQFDYQDEDLKIDESKKGTIRVLSAQDSQSSGKSTKFTLEKAISKTTQKNKESLTDVGATSKTDVSTSKTEINVPKDAIDAFDKEDEPEIAEDTNIDLKDFMIVTQNPLVSSYKLNITNIVPIKSVTEELYATEARKTRKFEATMVKFAPPNYIFVGTTASTVLIFDNNENLLKALKYTDGPQQTVTALDFFVDETDAPVLVVGFSGGHIAAFELKTFTMLKNVTTVQTQKITSIKIIKPDPLVFIASDESGQVVKYQMQKMLWFFAEEHRTLVINEAMTFDIQAMVKEMRARSSESLAEEQELRYIFALVKFEKVVIIDIRESVTTEAAKVIFSFMKPSYITESHLPSVSWGNASFHQHTRKTFLAIGWGSIVHLIKFSFTNAKPDFEYVGHFVLNWTIIRTVTWVNESSLAVMDQDDVLYFIQSEDFTEGEYRHEGATEIPDSPERRNIVEDQKIYTYLLADKLKAKLSFIDNKKNQKPFWGSAVASSYKTHEILILGEKGVYKVRPMNALEYLEKLCLDNEWLKFLTVGLQVYQLNVKEFRVPTDKRKRREVLLPFFREKVTAYLENQFKKEGESKQFYKEFMLSLIDFFTEVEDTEFLFIICQRKMAEYGLQEVFLEALEPFLISDRIKYIPDGQLKSVIIFYCSQGKRQLMQKLLLGLDLEKQDCFVLLHLCLEYNFYKALVDICTKVDDNYITPFVKLTSDYQFAKANGREEDAKNYGYRCLWYLKLCINKKLVLKSETAEKQHERWKNIMFQLMVMIFEPKNLQMFFEVDGELSICLILLFFVGDLAELVEEKYGDFFIGQVQTHDANIDDIHYQVYQALKNALKVWASEGERSKYLQNFGFFHGKVAQLLRYAFLDRVLCVDFVKRFINEPSLITDSILVSWEKSRLEYEGKSLAEIQEYFDSKVTSQFIHTQRTSIILDLLKYCQFTLSETEINNLVDKARDSNLIEIESTLLTMKAAYRECLELYLSPRAPHYYKENVFSWIAQTFRAYLDNPDKSTKEKQGVEELKLALVDKLPLLVSMDREISKAVMNEFLGDRMSLVLRKIRLDPTLQLEVLEKFLSKYDENKKIESEFLILHIHLLALNHKKGRKRVKDVLQRSNRYPLDACLDICQDNDIKDAWAYLELKRGDVAKAIEIIYTDFEEKVQKYLDKKEFVYKDKKDKIFKKIDVLLDYLGQLHKNPEKLWFDMLIKIFSLIDDKIIELSKQSDEESNKRRKELEELKKDVIDQMLDNIVGFFESKDVLRILNDKSQNIPESLKGKILTKIILHNAHENFILENCQSLVREDILMFHNIQLYPHAIKGSYSVPSCQHCLKQFVRSDSVLWFGCGHVFHASETCCSKGKCPICQTSIPALVARFVSVRGPNMRMPNKQGGGEIHETSNDAKPEEILKSQKETKAEKLKYKMNRMQEFGKYKVKKQKEWNKFLEKYC